LETVIFPLPSTTHSPTPFFLLFAGIGGGGGCWGKITKQKSPVEVSKTEELSLLLGFLENAEICLGHFRDQYLDIAERESIVSGTDAAVKTTHTHFNHKY
jgi:hypothetical protein